MFHCLVVWLSLSPTSYITHVHCLLWGDRTSLEHIITVTHNIITVRMSVYQTVVIVHVKLWVTGCEDKLSSRSRGVIPVQHFIPWSRTNLTLFVFYTSTLYINLPLTLRIHKHFSRHCTRNIEHMFYKRILQLMCTVCSSPERHLRIKLFLMQMELADVTTLIMQYNQIIIRSALLYCAFRTHVDYWPCTPFLMVGNYYLFFFK